MQCAKVDYVRSSSLNKNYENKDLHHHSVSHKFRNIASSDCADCSMTISYSGNFCRLLLRWKGSLWRSVWKELLIYLVIYYAIRLFYLIGIDYLFDDDFFRHKYRLLFVFPGLT
ncbi:hypothetical protein ANCCAN_26183 [Ancylostoma caninum]|uniref:Bestrophin homolog n=1 Tax=Ancylostoma caninum TaxID=29170 RepID=A0A368FD09_ANCCA|nr:hypothetical protein ANCCAN_26183 [Ancylostoma caninum]